LIRRIFKSEPKVSRKVEKQEDDDFDDDNLKKKNIIIG